MQGSHGLDGFLVPFDTVETAKKTDNDVVGSIAEFVAYPVSASLVKMETGSVYATVNEPEPMAWCTHFFQKIVCHTAVRDYHGIGYTGMQPAVDGVATGRALVSPSPDELEVETEKFEYAPQKEPFTPVTIDNVRTVRPEE
ncbi:hypothetical protein PSDVSF_07150 [Pseudodesulfovibrio sediminis]|uniref:Uncharacterized protein n=1 Tax=Pseudodesulfovibrio sediminis TaxID=2810563 RepID=A0ABN6EMX3_9BACT|nr:hypothetical protein PSDVSF_07150 [Pseudodesulfovibrio sediminis]